MIIGYTTIGQRCVMDTRKGTQCRLPASTIAGGLAVCPYHINVAVKLFREVENRYKDEHPSVFQQARKDSEYK